MRISGLVLSLGLAVGVAGCTGDIDAIPGYIGVPGDHVRTNVDKFDVHDRAGDGRMMVVSSFEASHGEGPRLRTAQRARNVFGDAARAYLNRTRRSTCEIQGVNMVTFSMYEVAYECPSR